MRRCEVDDCHYYYDISPKDMKKLLERLSAKNYFWVKNILADRLLTRLQAVHHMKRDHSRVTNVVGAVNFNLELMKGR